MRSGRASAADPLDPGLQGERRRLEQLAFGTEWLEERGPPGFTTPEAAVGALPVWDAERVAGVARRAHLLGPTGTVAAAALSPRRLGGGRATWLIGAAPDLDRLARTQPPPPWTEIHRGSWARTGRALAAAEADSGLELAPVLGGDSVAWFGEGFGEFAVAPSDTWPQARPAGIPLTAWWRRTALAWVLQSPELTRAETDGLVLLWRRDVAERLGRLAPVARFDGPVPAVADGGPGWRASGHGGLAAPPAGVVRPGGAKPGRGGGGGGGGNGGSERDAVVGGAGVRSGAAGRGGRAARGHGRAHRPATVPVAPEPRDTSPRPGARVAADGARRAAAMARKRRAGFGAGPVRAGRDRRRRATRAEVLPHLGRPCRGGSDADAGAA